MSTQLLSATAITKSFPTAGGDLDILRGVSLQLAEKEAIAVTGPSGCGKSTFLSILGALDLPTSGELLVAGTDPTKLSEVDRAGFRNQTVGFVFQDHHLLPQCTVLENVLIPVLASRTATAEDRNRAEHLLNELGLADRKNHLPGQISGGERQRAALCRALINEPRLILADEPTGNLDPKTADTVGAMLLGLVDTTDAALICVTHSMTLADQFPRRVRLLDGKIDS